MNREKTQQFSSEHFLQDNTPLYIKGWSFKHLEGRLLTLIESMGLPEKQEEAVKGYIRKEVWATVYECLVVSEKDQNEIEKFYICQSIETTKTNIEE